MASNLRLGPVINSRSAPAGSVDQRPIHPFGLTTNRRPKIWPHSKAAGNMGHRAHQGFPRTPALKRVVSLLGSGAGAPGTVGISPGSLAEIADATLSATTNGLDRAKTDEGLAYCLFLMANVTRAAKGENFAQALADLGIGSSLKPRGTPDYPLPPAGGKSELNVFDLVSGFSAAFDRHLRATRSRSDIGEMAHLAAAESLSAVCGASAQTLWGSTQETVQNSLAKMSGEKGFARLAHDFFARFSRRYLEYHLSRELSNHVGADRRFKGVSEHNQFLQQLDDHCRVTTASMRQFAGEWYSRHRWLQDITLRKTKGFTAHAIDKVRDAMAFREARDVA